MNEWNHYRNQIFSFLFLITNEAFAALYKYLDSKMNGKKREKESFINICDGFSSYSSL